MIRIFGFLMIFILCMPAYAEDPDRILFETKHPKDAVSGRDYTILINKIQLRDQSVSFNHLRYLYPKMAFYEPETDLLVPELFKKAEIIKKLDPMDDKKAYEEALGLYNDFIMVHMAHTDVVWAAYMLANDNKALGDPALYRWVYKGLKASLMSSGDGKTPENAYRIITFGEEQIILDTLRSPSFKVERVTDGSLRYHMHTVYDPETDKVSTLFTNVTIPLPIRAYRGRNAINIFDFTSIPDQSLKAPDLP